MDILRNQMILSELYIWKYVNTIYLMSNSKDRAVTLRVNCDVFIWI